MKGIPTNKATQTARILSDAIARGEWAKHLPGERSLSRELMISRGCLREALEILTNEGVLAPVEKSKRRTILKSKQQSRSDQVVFFTPKAAHRATPLVLEQVARLRNYLAKEGRAIEWLTSKVFNNPRTSDRTMAELVGAYPDAHWVLHQCPAHIQEWFSNHRSNATVLGSLFPGVQLTSVDIDFFSASRHATGHLLAKGHRRLGLIRFRSELAGDNQAVEGLYDALRSHRSELTLPEPLIMSHNFHTERLMSRLDQVFSSRNRPTALIVLNHHHFITAFTHLLSRKLRVPEEVSLISLSHDKVLDRFSPKPVSYSVGERLIEKLVRIIINPALTAQKKSTLLVPEMMPGNSVGPPP